MRAAFSLCLLALLSNVACTSFRPPATGASLDDRTVRVSSPGGVTVTLPHPDGSGRTLSCGARFVDGRIGAIVGDTVQMRTITQRSTDADAPYACRSVRAGAVVARRGNTFTLAVKEFDGFKTITLVALVALFVTTVLTAEWEYETPPTP